MLAVTSDKDIQVDPDDDVIAATVPGSPAPSRPSVCLTSPILRRDPAQPTVAAYRKLVPQPIDSEVVALVTDWVVQHSDAGPVGAAT